MALDNGGPSEIVELLFVQERGQLVRELNFLLP
jgi:hypothetical protein